MSEEQNNRSEKELIGKQQWLKQLGRIAGAFPLFMVGMYFVLLNPEPTNKQMFISWVGALGGGALVLKAITTELKINRKILRSLFKPPSVGPQEIPSHTEEDSFFEIPENTTQKS